MAGTIYYLMYSIDTARARPLSNQDSRVQGPLLEKKMCFCPNEIFTLQKIRGRGLLLRSKTALIVCKCECQKIILKCRKKLFAKKSIDIRGNVR